VDKCNVENEDEDEDEVDKVSPPYDVQSCFGVTIPPLKVLKNCVF
jgi:hypothetical protein